MMKSLEAVERLKKLINHGYKVITVIVAKGRKEEEEHIKQLMLKANEQLGIEEVIIFGISKFIIRNIPLHVINK